MLKNQDNAHYDMLVRNWEVRRAEEEQSLQNVERWRQEVYNMRIENIRTLKTSKILSQQLVADHKRSYDEDSVSSGSSFAGRSGLFWGQQDDTDSAIRFAVSTNTSSVVCVCYIRREILCLRFIWVVSQVRVPADIEDKVKNAKRYTFIFILRNVIGWDSSDITRALGTSGKRTLSLQNKRRKITLKRRCPCG